MATFELSLVAPEEMVFSGEVDQVDMPGSEGDLGILAGHAPMVSMLRPGIVTVRSGSSNKRFVVLGGLAELSQSGLTILADSAKPLEEFDLAALETIIEGIEENLPTMTAGEEFDRELARLDHFRSIHVHLGTATPF
ncbi:MAG: F0F1 ATP synthase subunit epsilon [Xanthobacteraceae bacterium]|nr:F0F1 ATP synthase subunit epsilon [Xanthobacteraceae bacterium]